MKLSVHKHIRGKPRQEYDEAEKRHFMYQDGRRVNPGWNWMNIEATWPEVFELITVDGCATSAELSSDNRKEEFFVSRELIMVDIDAGMSIEELLADDFYNQYGAGFYVTPSYTDLAPRFRIMFRLQTPITDASTLRKVNRMLINIYAQADQSCKDPTRLFYGTPNCVIKECRENLLTDDMVDALVLAQDRLDAEEMEAQSLKQAEYPDLTDERRAEILKALRGIYLGFYPTWRNVGWGLKSGGFSLQDFQYVTVGMMRQKTLADAADVWRSGSADGKVTMGSVIWLIRQHLGDDFMREVKSETREQRKLSKLQYELAAKYGRE